LLSAYVRVDLRSQWWEQLPVPKTGPATDLDDYAPVAERIALFYQRFPSAVSSHD